jgi:hypothetical protein
MFSDVLLRDEGNKRPIEALQRPSTEVVEAVYRSHKVILDDVPASLVKGSSETIRSRGFVSRQCMNCVHDFLLCEWEVKRWVIDLAELKSIPIKRTCSLRCGSKDERKIMVQSGLLLIVIPDNAAIALFEVGDQVSVSSVLGLLMEEFSTCITLFYL